MTADASDVAQAAAAVAAAERVSATTYGPGRMPAVIGEGPSVPEPSGLEGGQPGDPVPKPQY